MLSNKDINELNNNRLIYKKNTNMVKDPIINNGYQQLEEIENENENESMIQKDMTNNDNMIQSEMTNNDNMIQSEMINIDNMIQSEMVNNDNNIIELMVSDCPICMNIIDLVDLPCGHKICENCRKGIYPDDKGKKNCPFCRETYETIIEKKKLNKSLRVHPNSRVTTNIYIERDLNENKYYSYIICSGCIVATFCCLFGNKIL